MKRSILVFVFTTIFSVGGISQTPPADADPVLQGTASYKMPQSAIDAEIYGKVVMAIHIDKSGKPTKASLAAGPMWPCGKNPVAALNSLSSALSDAMLLLRFFPAIKGGKPMATDVNLELTLKNPNLDRGPPEKDPVTGKPIQRIISGGVLNGKATSLPIPAYPAEAKIARVGGVVPVQVLFDEKGYVIRAGATGGHPLLQLSARQSACGAKFKPVTLQGEPIKVSGLITYNFDASRL